MLDNLSKANENTLNTAHEPAPRFSAEELAAMPEQELRALVKRCRERLEFLHAQPVYWNGAQEWSELLTYAQSELRFRAQQLDLFERA